MSITNNELTTGNVGGDGTFDILMSAMNAHLQAQFTKGALTGPQYSEVYLGGMNSAMSQAMQFLLQRETTNKQNLLLDEQITQAAIQTAQLEFQNLQIQKQTEQLTAQIAQTEAQTLLITEQKEQVTLQNEQIALQNNEISARVLQIEAQTALAVQQELLAQKQVLQADKELEKANAEIALLTQQHEINELTKQKAQAEITLLTQKVKTERAQIEDTIDGIDVVGSVGRQNALYEQQTQGFKRDNEQKVSKIFTDIYSVLRSTDDRIDIPYGSILSFNSEMESVLNAVKDNVVPTTP